MNYARSHPDPLPQKRVNAETLSTGVRAGIELNLKAFKMSFSSTPE